VKNPRCPFLNKPCIEQECMMWTHVTMTNPQSGATEDKWTCALAMTPIMVLEGARQTRGVQASVESMRNEVTQRQDQFNQLVIGAQNNRKIGQKPEGNNREGLENGG